MNPQDEKISSHIHLQFKKLVYGWIILKNIRFKNRLSKVSTHSGKKPLNIQLE